MKPILVSESLLDSMHRDVNCSLDLCLDIMINIFFFLKGRGERDASRRYETPWDSGMLGGELSKTAVIPAH